MTHERAGLKRKREIAGAITDMLRRSHAVFLTDFRGLDVAGMTRLRRRLREGGAQYLVAKNTLIRRAAADSGMAGIEPFLGGPSGLCFAYENPVSAARLLSDFARESRVLAVKGGWMDGRVLSTEDVVRLATLPGREVLLGQVAGAMGAPMRALVTVLAGNIRQLVVVLDAVRRQKEGAPAQGAA